MVRWTRDRLRVAVGLILLSGAIGLMGWAFLIPPNQRNDTLVLPAFALALVGVLVEIFPLVARLGRRATARSVQVVADRLADAVDGWWRKEAYQRRLLPDTIPLRWSLSDLAVAGPLTAAVGAPGTPPAFQPLPGYARITETDLHTGGGRTELHSVYAGLGSGRIVVVGAPGAGKSGTAILLLLDALTYRGTLDDPRQRARVPVPVLLTVHGWNPINTSVQDWLADQLVLAYPMFAHRGGRAEAAALVAARDKVALLLDGLDEMDVGLRSTALQALSDAPFRVVVLTRSQEMAQATSQALLAGAVAVRLHEVTATEAAEYLRRALTGPSPSGWAELLTHLHEHPAGEPTRGLSTPLTLTLLRDTYQPGDDVRRLIHLTRSHSPDTIEQHLIARVLPAAYALRPGRPTPRYTEQQARQTLSFIARQMGPDRDLVWWWHINRWAPRTPRVLATVLLAGLCGLVDGWGGLGAGFVAGLGFGFWAEIQGLEGSEPRRVRLANWRVALSPRVLRKALVWGLLFGLIFGLGIGLLVGFMVAFEVEFLVALVGGFVGGLVVGLGGALLEGGTGEGSSLGPYEVWRDDRMAGLLVGLGGGLVLGLPVVLMFALIGLGGVLDRLHNRYEGHTQYEGRSGVGLWARFWDELGHEFMGKPGVTLWGLLLFLFVLGLGAGLVLSRTWVATLAWLQLRWSGSVSAVGLMPFLEDARKRGVLRTVGAVYQFRHATLQDQLTVAAFEQVVADRLRVLGPDHPDTLASRGSLASWRGEAGDAAGAATGRSRTQ